MVMAKPSLMKTRGSKRGSSPATGLSFSASRLTTSTSVVNLARYASPLSQLALAAAGVRDPGGVTRATTSHGVRRTTRRLESLRTTASSTAKPSAEAVALAAATARRASDACTSVSPPRLRRSRTPRETCKDADATPYFGDATIATTPFRLRVSAAADRLSRCRRSVATCSPVEGPDRRRRSQRAVSSAMSHLPRCRPPPGAILRFGVCEPNARVAAPSRELHRRHHLSPREDPVLGFVRRAHVRRQRQDRSPTMRGPQTRSRRRSASTVGDS